MSNVTLAVPTSSAAMVAETIQTIPSFAMVPRKKPGCKLDGQLVASLYIPAASYPWNPQWGYLSAAGFNFKGNPKSFVVEVYAGGKILTCTTPDHPLSRNNDERLSEWLDRVCTHPLCKGISVLILATALSKAQVDRLYSTLLPPKYSAEVSDKLVAAFCSGEPAAPPALASAPPQPSATTYSTSIKPKPATTPVEPTKQPTPVPVKPAVTAPIPAVSPTPAAMSIKEMKAAWVARFGYSAPSIRNEDFLILYNAKIAAE